MQTHLIAKPLTEWGIESHVYWSIAPARKAVVFVHGFKGSALGTWLEFPRLMQQMRKCAGCDLFFYGYNSTRIRATNSAYFLRKFLKEVVENPARLSNSAFPPLLKRPANFSYDNVVISAHSLGAVVSRQALLDAYLSQEKWASKTLLVLFAPAHQGASILPLLYESLGELSRSLRFAPKGQIVGLLLTLWVAVTKWRWRVLRDLEPGSRTLEKLLSDTMEAIKTGTANFLVAPIVLHALNDDVVEPIRFANDAPHEVIVGKSHTEACKPSIAFLQPIQAVTKLL